MMTLAAVVLVVAVLFEVAEGFTNVAEALTSGVVVRTASTQEANANLRNAYAAR